MTDLSAISPVLVANRGEIAVRIIRACQDAGLESVAVHSEGDAGALWTRLADQALAIGPTPARESYLDIERLIDAARRSGARAVHPGYGLLSENPAFAQAVADAGLAFIGPSPQVIAVMGDKVAARAAAVAADLPVLPGSSAIENPDAALRLAEGIGWPVAVKASFGGGGRGMRVAWGVDALAAAMAQAMREAGAAFGRSDIYLERYLARPRHVEVQVLGDRHGAVIHLGDRDCSVQRRHQKLIEEAPAPNLSPTLRARMAEAAVRLARSVGYESAGTVEFLVDAEADSFYFLEMNTRIQVEHGVTEMVTGVDLVREQLRVAAGLPLGVGQHDVQVRGHAIQARIAAEDPWEGFRPTPGRIARLDLPLGPWLRHDFGVESGDEVSGAYDSMFGKVQAYGQDREDARRRLGRALGVLVVAGPPTTAPYLRQVLDQPAFAAATHDTGALERDWPPRPEDRPAETPTPEPLADAGTGAGTGAGAGWDERRVALPWGGALIETAIYARHRPGSRALETRAGAGRGPNRTAVPGRGGPDLLASMDAAVADVPVGVGDVVRRGQPVVVLEAMKMEVIVAAPHDGRVTVVQVAAGDAVKAGDLLVRLHPDGDAGNEPR